jgi:hypothetical protein
MWNRESNKFQNVILHYLNWNEIRILTEAMCQAVHLILQSVSFHPRNTAELKLSSRLIVFNRKVVFFKMLLKPKDRYSLKFYIFFLLKMRCVFVCFSFKYSLGLACIVCINPNPNPKVLTLKKVVKYNALAYTFESYAKSGYVLNYPHIIVKN